jgi:ABC-type spermidine/putrescine transport system permease subunit II
MDDLWRVVVNGRASNAAGIALTRSRESGDTSNPKVVTMTTWFKRRFRDSEHAQKTLLGFAVALGVVGFVIVIGACFASAYSKGTVTGAGSSSP